MSHSSTRQFSAILLASAMLCIAPMTTAQESADAEAEDDQVVLDTVKVTGVQDDAAMAAFRAGDYQTAEVEFLDNARCALRRERALESSVDNARIEADRAETFANAGTTSDSGVSSRGQTANAGQQASTGIAARTGGSARNLKDNYERTCDARGRQLYFAGLSQIQLGKTNEALRNFEKATAASSILYDAHYKIGLIKLLTGDPKTAESELRKIEGILQRCRDCEAKSEIVERRDHLRKAIDGEVSLQ